MEATGAAVDMAKCGDPNWDIYATPTVVDMQQYVAALKENNYNCMAEEFSTRLDNYNDIERKTMMIFLITKIISY